MLDINLQQHLQMPKDLFSSMRKMTSTRDFLVQMNMYQQEKKKGNLPSQMKKLKSRIDGLSLAGINNNLESI